MMSCVFATNGVVMPFLPQSLAEKRGLSGLEIGAVLSSAQMARVVIGPPIAAWADGFRDRRTPVRVLSAAAAGFYALFLSSSGFGALLAAGFCALACAAALTPLLEGAAMRAARGGGLGFGVTRAIGSAAFVVASLAAGGLIDLYSIDVAPALVLGWITAAALTAAFVLRPEPAPALAAGLGFRGDWAWPDAC